MYFTQRAEETCLRKSKKKKQTSETLAHLCVLPSPASYLELNLNTHSLFCSGQKCPAWQAWLIRPRRQPLSSTEDVLYALEWLESRYEGEGRSMKAGLRDVRLGN